jgi:MFS transporter, DHA1 family, inner membrane transport protein
MTLRQKSNSSLLVLLAVGTFATGTDAFVLNGLLATIATDLRVSLAEGGLLVTLFAVTYAVAAPVVAALTGNWDRRRLLGVSQLVFAVGMVCQAAAGGFALMAGGRVIAAIGAAGYVANATATGAALVGPERRGRALAVVMGGLTSATVLGAPIGVLVGDWFGWRVTLYGIAALGLVAAAGTLALPQVELPSITIRTRLAVLARPGVLQIMVVTTALLASAFTLYTFLPEVAAPVVGGTGLSWLLFSWGAASAVGNWLAGRWTDRAGPLLLLRATTLATAVVLSLVSLAAHNAVALFVAVIAWGALGWMTIVPQQHRLLSLAPDAAPVVIGWNGSATYAGTALGSLIGSGVLNTTGATWLGPTAGLVMLVAFAFTWLKIPSAPPIATAATPAPSTATRRAT